MFAHLLLSMMLLDQAQEPPKPTIPKVDELPPEEDPSAKPKEYSFNPLQAEKEMQTGKYYLHRGKSRPAADRFREATRWNPTLAEAFQWLGEAEEKNHDKKARARGLHEVSGDGSGRKGRKRDKEEAREVVRCSRTSGQ